LVVIFLLLYFQFRKVSVTLMVFSGVFVAWGGGFILLWLYAQPWFLETSLLGTNLRELFQIEPYNLSVAVWVGFLALFGIATDDGVIMATRIEQVMAEEKPDSIEAIRKAVVDGGQLRIRAAVMTSATTILALLPVLTSTGRGSDIMVPMAIPSFGGMAVASITWFVVPILYCSVQEWRHRLTHRNVSNPVVAGRTLKQESST
jgi:Cu(I)/Ag(I) efflux system membrane protein CusA/SilA